MNTKWPFAWKTTLYRFGWWQFALCMGTMGLWLILSQTEGAERNHLITAVRTAEILIPLFAGMQAAYAFSPDDEQPLEIMLATPRSILWTIAERLIVILIGYGSLGLTTSLLIHASFNVGDVTVGQTIIRWLPPLIWFIGVGLYLTLITRQGMFGTLMIMVIWGTSLLSSGGIPEKYLAIAPIMPYLQRGAANISDNLYTLNRITLIATGLLLIGLALRIALDNERLLGLKTKKLKDRKLIPLHLRQSPNLPIPPDKGVCMSTKLSQLLGIIRYEMQLQWQRRSLPIVTLFFIAVGIILLLLSRDGASQEGLSQTAVTFAIIFTTAPFTFLLMVLGIPPVVAEAVAKDAQVGMDELRDSLPISPGLYLLGKLLGIWACILIMMAALALSSWLTARLFLGSIDLFAYLETWLVGIIPASLFVAALSVLLASRQPNRKRATMVGATIAMYSLISFPLGFSTEYSFAQTLLPSAWFSLIMEKVMDYAAASTDLPTELIFMADMPDWFRWQTVLATAVQLTVVWLAVWGYWKWRAA